MNRSALVSFSRRTAWERTPNRLADAWARCRSGGLASFDLTESNPTRCGFPYPEARILRALADPRGLHYAPDPRGLSAAREAVAGYLAAELPGAAPCAPESLVLTASTSEAYGWLMKLLCERGDRVLVPRPSYPLFEFLAGLEEVTLAPYLLRREERWRLDLDSVTAAADSRTRAIIVVHPNNPTGSALSVAEADALAAICSARGMAIISDEVFLEYLYPSPAGAGAGRHPPSPAGSLAPRGGCLAFSLGGLSKSAGLPQIKVGWIRAGGPPELAREARARLEVIADTYLSVNTPAQWALAELLDAGRTVRAAIRHRTAANRRWLASRTAGTAADLLPADGGWYAVLRVPRTRTEEEWCLLLAEEEQVLVHPGFFFDFESEAYLVASLLPGEAAFAEAMARVLRRLG